jgi:ubiquinone/menaquinone biosynthesis C-methylase UbiE
MIFRSKNVGLNNLSFRENWLQKTLLELPSGSKILDAGAGELKYKKFCTHLEYVSQDFCQYDGKGDESGLQTQKWDNSRIDIVSDITDIPLPDNSFDAIMCIEVIEHIPNPLAAFKEFHRLLKPGGILVDMGFTINEMVANGNYFEYIAQELRRLPWVMNKYSVLSYGRILRWLIQMLLIFLEKASKNDRGSSELLCYGYQIKATRL